MPTTTFSNVDSLIADFAKSTKVSKAKLAEFVSALQNSAVVKIEGIGRKTSEDSLKVREYITSHSEELAGRKLTVKEFSLMIGVDAQTVTNNLKWLSENQKNVKMVGFAEKQVGKRGKVPALWSVSEVAASE